MSILEIPISQDYVPSWGTWECIREAIQNGLDEDERGFPLNISHKNNMLSISNHGANIHAQALILGKTDKRGSTLRGEHGEGLTLSLLTGARNEMHIKVLTQDETWQPSIQWSDNYKDNILVVKTRALRQKRDGVEVQIKVDKEIWSKTKKLFTKFAGLKDNEILQCDRGSVILNPEFRGQIFSKGIYVMTEPKFSYGYDLKYANLDRDRRVIGDFDLKWEIANILKEAGTRYPTMFEKVYKLLEDNSKELEYAGPNFDKGIKDKVVKSFKKKHGDEAIPVRSMDEASRVASIGKKGILVQDTLGRILESSSEINSPSKLGEQLKYSISHFYNWDELEAEEQANLQTAARELNTCIENLNILDHTTIVDFTDPNHLGHWVEDKIRVARKVLKDYKETFHVLLHEEAHLQSGATDGEIGFERSLEELWMKVYFSKEEGRGRGRPVML